MILICANEFAGPTGYHKSVVETANALHRAGYPIGVLSFLGGADGARAALPNWPLDVDIQACVLQTLPAEGGRMLHRNYHVAFTASMGSMSIALTANQLASLRQLNEALSTEDTLLFTSPVQAIAFKRALDGAQRRPRTVLQIHGDYFHHPELWNALMDSRDVIDRLQTVANGLRAQFLPVFAPTDVVFIPNIHDPVPLERTEHEGVNIVLPASFQDRKNQLDAVRALSLVDDVSVHLTLWGNINQLNPYYIAVRQLIDSLGLDERVHIPGFGTENDVYASADIVVMTSLSEGFGYPLIEAAYHRLPAVAYDFDFGPRETIEPGRSGYIVPLGDVEQLAAKLTELGADEALRTRFGHEGRRIFDERFSTSAISEMYRQLLGPSRATLDLVDTFATNGIEPIASREILHRYHHRLGRGLHRVTVNSPIKLHDVQIDNGSRIESPRVQPLPGATQIEFSGDGDEVISYATAPGSSDRHYLANTHGTGLQVLPYLRRDANYGDGVSPMQNAIFAASGGARRIGPRESAPVLKDTATLALSVLNSQIRQAMGSARRVLPASESPQPASSSFQLPVEPGATSIAAQNTSLIDQAREPHMPVARAIGLPSAATSSLLRVATTYGKTAVTSLALRLTTVPQSPTRREMARHPQFPVVSGVDNFGVAINQRDGVIVRNTGTPASPTVSVEGEYDWLLLGDATGARRVEPPFSYGALFERICSAERDHGLFDITTPDGTHIWELGRSALVIQLAEAMGLWGKESGLPAPVRDHYAGPKRLTKAPKARRVVFDYARRGQSGYRTAAFRDDETLFVVPPDRDGYPEVDDTDQVFPLHEFTRWRNDWRRRLAHLRVHEVDARPFESALSSAFGMHVSLGSHLRNRLAQFLAEREFWTPVFERVQPEEVLIAASHWHPGMVAAAERAGALVSDIQYAETGKYHGSYWFGGKPNYGASRLYAWSEEWASRTNVYREHVVMPRQQPELAVAIASDDRPEQMWDVCVISQTRVFRRILAFVQDLIRERPTIRVVVAPHPVQRDTIEAHIAAAGLIGKVTIAQDDTLTTVQKSAMCVGAYSTSMWEAAAIGRPTFVIPVPGHELTLLDVESGLFRIATSPADLAPYELPESRKTIFGH